MRSFSAPAVVPSALRCEKLVTNKLQTSFVNFVRLYYMYVQFLSPSDTVQFPQWEITEEYTCAPVTTSDLPS